ncbi:hypothetical protein IEO21_08841 [Rhodonia placenta]|uniref:Uncharacterized protein n=1 Tax=Rhodonia placenta TaxID=104341 RepID=A0A8H7NVM3_9APHY|nr:hypothetical protein IEO21_08841 [Postia placenta]
MPTRRAPAGGLARAHARTNSGGSSKLGLNLQFTQKDAPPPRLPDKLKKNAHVHHDTSTRAGAPAFSRTNSSHHVPSREHVQAAQLRRAPTPLASARQNNNGRQKVDFRISSPSEGDEDEWVSSESGAATPNTASADSDAEEPTTPVTLNKLSLAQANSQLNGFHREDVETPKAEVPLLPRVDTARLPEPPSPAPAARDYAQDQPATLSVPQPQPHQLDRHDQLIPEVERQPELSAPTLTRARSETCSPHRLSPPPKRQSMTRPPSTHSVTSRTDSAALRPHPLIRGHSYGQTGGFAAMPAPLAPLTMVSSDAAQAQMSTASSPTSMRAGSPSSIKTASASPIQTSPSSTSQAHKQLRRTSTSSVRSTATLPVQPSPSQIQLSKSSHDRQRTLSAISSSSSFAALSSLGLRSTPSPPRTPISFTSHFPPAEAAANLEQIHPLLPPPYLNAHLSVLTYRNPIAEAYDRVIRAKQAR